MRDDRRQFATLPIVVVVAITQRQRRAEDLFQ
jgi:hypothetical protein